jgi:hypothetical protein
MLGTETGVYFGVLDKGDIYSGEEIFKFTEKKDEVYLLGKDIKNIYEY